MKRRTIILSLKLAISGGMIAFLFKSVNVDALSVQILHIHNTLFLLAIISTVVQILISALRWRAVMVATNAALPYLECLRLYIIGVFFNQLLPSSVGGDGIRMYKAYKSGLSVASAIHSVILERVATILGLVIVFILTVPLFINNNEFAEMPLNITIVIVLVIGAIGGISVLTHLDYITKWFGSWRLRAPLIELSNAARLVFFVPKHIRNVITWSLLGHLLIVVKVYFLALSVGVDISFAECVIITILTLLAMTLPISIAGWGVREGVMVGAFGLIGVSMESALAISILFGIIGILQAIPGGIIWIKSSSSTPPTPPHKQAVT